MDNTSRIEDLAYRVEVVSENSIRALKRFLKKVKEWENAGGFSSTTVKKPVLRNTGDAFNLYYTFYWTGWCTWFHFRPVNAFSEFEREDLTREEKAFFNAVRERFNQRFEEVE